eukprot:3235013-Rhodomonas_salina.2
MPQVLRRYLPTPSRYIPMPPRYLPTTPAMLASAIALGGPPLSAMPFAATALRPDIRYGATRGVRCSRVATSSVPYAPTPSIRLSAPY